MDWGHSIGHATGQLGNLNGTAASLENRVDALQLCAMDPRCTEPSLALLRQARLLDSQLGELREARVHQEAELTALSSEATKQADHVQLPHSAFEARFEQLARSQAALRLQEQTSRQSLLAVGRQKA